MHAADVVETLPAARLDDAFLPAVRTMLRHGLPGLVVVDDRGQTVACMSSVDLLRLALPRYVHEQPILARVFDERHADQIADRLARTTVRDVVGELAGRIPMVRSEATLVELAETMTQLGCPLTMVEPGEGGGAVGVVTVNHLLEVLVAAAGSRSR